MRSLLKAVSEFVCLRLLGKAFQRIGIAVEKAHSVYLTRFGTGDRQKVLLGGLLMATGGVEQE